MGKATSASKVTIKVTAKPNSGKGGGKEIYKSKAKIVPHLNTGTRK